MYCTVDGSEFVYVPSLLTSTMKPSVLIVCLVFVLDTIIHVFLFFKMDCFFHQLMAVIGLHTATRESLPRNRQSILASVSAVVADHLRDKQELQRIQQVLEEVSNRR